MQQLTVPPMPAVKELKKEDGQELLKAQTERDIFKKLYEDTLQKLLEK